MPRFRGQPGEGTNRGSLCFASAKPIGTEDGNLIWGRQLWPALLLESSAMNLEILWQVRSVVWNPTQPAPASCPRLTHTVNGRRMEDWFCECRQRALLLT
ncbi:hypothetical protein CDL15_Pgr023438 [Punica granatum]|uniref:Uncharacterized protein n=1 Tax=Punica granatum TaxID=22663 RepID=A0A218XW66_PUNGR|nr:hypothetical protein CDL15_Pgr023438 [Punica granatum]